MNASAGGGEAVVEAELVEHDFEVIDVHLAGEVFAAGAAVGARALLTGFFVEAHHQRAGALEDVEELAERNVEQQRDDADHVDHGPQPVAAAGEEFVAHGQREAGDGDGEDEDQREDVLDKGLRCALTGVGDAPPGREHQADEHDDGGEVQQVEHHERLRAVDAKLVHGEAEGFHLIDFRVVGEGFEMHPAEHERERDGEREGGAAGQAHVHDPAQRAAARDEALGDELGGEGVAEGAGAEGQG